jgi:hypothetical protein
MQARSLLPRLPLTTTMNYTAATVHESIRKLNRKYFLPALQREFVWKEPQITRLFDSLMRGYPISSLLFWKPRGNAATTWPSYKFLDTVSAGGTPNEIANLNGTRGPIFVLDGQQRLTALNIGLRGFYNAKEKGRRRNNPDAWKKKKLYLDLLHRNRGDEVGDDDETDVEYRFTFFEDRPPNTRRNCWFEVGKILHCITSTTLSAHCRRAIRSLPVHPGRQARSAIQKNLKRLQQAIFSDPAILFHTETRPEYERVLNIFVRANEAGTQLSKSDLLLSTITSNWQDQNAREEIRQFVVFLNKDLGAVNYFEKDFIIKCAFVLCDLPVKYSLRSFNRQSLLTLESSWPDIKVAIGNCVRLINRFGINGENLTSANALIPITYYLYHQDRADLAGNSRWEVRNAASIQRWICMALLNRVFSGSSDTMLAALRDVLKKHGRLGKDFPISILNEAISARGRSASFNEETIDNILLLQHGQPEAFFALTLLYDDTMWSSAWHDQDHIFAKSNLEQDKLVRKGLSPEEALSCQQTRNRLANLQLLTQRENRQKSSKSFLHWLRTRSRAFKRRHLIPTSSKLYALTKFSGFLNARERLIRRRLRGLFRA